MEFVRRCDWWTGSPEPKGPYGEYLAGLAEGGHNPGDFNLATYARFMLRPSRHTFPECSSTVERREGALRRLQFYSGRASAAMTSD
jgi:hypothetical protein